jgi:hypothetical protein
MTIVAYHKGVLHADDQVLVPVGFSTIAESCNKIKVSKCGRFAYAISGILAEGYRAELLESYLLKHLVDFYQNDDLLTPKGIGSEGYGQPLLESMIVMTRDAAWMVFVDPEAKTVGLIPAVSNSPFLMGTGADAVLAMFALGWTVEKAVARAHHYVQTCSRNVNKVAAKDLKPFKIVRAKNG